MLNFYGSFFYINYIIYPIFVQCCVMGRFGHENGPFWMSAGAVLALFFLPFGPFWFAWAVFDLHWGHFGDGPFWSVPDLSLRAIKCWSVVFGITLRVFVINILPSSPAINK